MRYDRTPADQELVHPAYVVLDSNAWIQEWLLQTILGSKLVNLVVHLQARLLLPEIVEREITTKTILRAEEAVKKARAEINKISLLTQANFNPSLPDSEKMRSAVAGRLQELAGLIEREEFTFTTARAALERIFQKLPPCNQDNEQFRDACIWESCMRRGQVARVLLVSGDTAFFEGKKLENGINRRLTEELQMHRSQVELFPSVLKLVEAFEPGVPETDPMSDARLLVSELESVLYDRASAAQFELGEVVASEITLSATNSSVVRLARFRIDLSLNEAGHQLDERLNPILTVEGTAAINIVDRSLSQVRPNAITISWTNPQGTTVKSTHHHFHVLETLSAGTAISVTSG